MDNANDIREYIVLISMICEQNLSFTNHILSWEPEGRYQYSKMFRWEPEGHYHRTKSMITLPSGSQRNIFEQW